MVKTSGHKDGSAISSNQASPQVSITLKSACRMPRDTLEEAAHTSCLMYGHRFKLLRLDMRTNRLAIAVLFLKLQTVNGSRSELE